MSLRPGGRGSVAFAQHRREIARAEAEQQVWDVVQTGEQRGDDVEHA